MKYFVLSKQGYRLVQANRPTRKIPQADLELLLEACKRLPLPSKVPSDMTDTLRPPKL